MQTIQHSFHSVYTTREKSQSLFSRLITWCEGQEKFRFGWVAAILTIHGCVLAPITVLTITLGGNHFAFWGVAIGAIAMALIVNLAAMPTKITIPVFFLSVLIDIVIIASNIVLALS
jgi:Mg2+ and Co2+ transporter CorA